MTLNLLIGGEAGQGLVTIGEVLARALVRQGYRIVVTQSYMSRVRGGHNTFALRVSDREIKAPRETYDLLVALNQETLDLHLNELSSDAVIIAENKIECEGPTCISVPFKDLADKRTENVAALAVLATVLGLDLELLEQTIDDHFGKKPEAREKNEQTLEQAAGWAESIPDSSRRPLPKVEPAGRIMLHGNQAIALGAAAAGLKFYSFYPMTPGTSIGITLAGKAQKLGIVVEQAEDEIAAINMALGASYAGAPAMTGTSGGGFALMVEGISLAAMIETPVVVAVSQRPGPATGLPTRTEQGDLELILHAGHGEFPRAVYAPGSIEQCFHLTRKAFRTAERAQGPVFILTDQFLADSYRAVEPFPSEDLQAVCAADDHQLTDAPYRRYRLTDSGASPRLLPGLSKHLVVADSDEHDEAGHITEDLELRVKMVDKRLRKIDLILREVVPPEYTGDEDPDLLLLCWGSTRGAAHEAAELLREQGKKTAVLHFGQVWPLPPETFLPRLEKAREVVAVEGNAFGQFARLVRRETGFEIKRKVLRYDGLPMTPEYILRGLAGEGG